MGRDLKDDLEGLFAAALSDPSIDDPAPANGKSARKKAPASTLPGPANGSATKRPATGSAPAPGAAMKRETSLPSLPKKEATIPPPASSPKASIPPAPKRSIGPAAKNATIPPGVMSALDKGALPPGSTPTRSTPPAKGASLPAEHLPPGKREGSATAKPTTRPTPAPEPRRSQLPGPARDRGARGGETVTPEDLGVPRKSSLPEAAKKAAPGPVGDTTPVPKRQPASPAEPSSTKKAPSAPAMAAAVSGADARAKPVSVPTPGAAPAAGKRARRDLELIEYEPDEPLIDHKGRSKPMYKPRSPRPRTWRPSRPIRLMLGLFPGTRVMALESFRAGLPYTVLGLLAIIPTLFLLIGWSRTTQELHALSIDERWLIAHAAGAIALLSTFELLRLASFFEEPRAKELRAPRILAAFTVPAVATAIAGPELVSLWPRLVEATWFSSVIVAAGAVIASIWCAAEGTLEEEGPRLAFRVAGLVVLAGLIGAGVATGVFGAESVRMVASVAKAAGFRALPALLGV